MPSTFYEEVKASLANAALARTDISVGRPTPEPMLDAVVSTNGIHSGSHHGLVTLSSVSSSWKN